MFFRRMFTRKDNTNADGDDDDDNDNDNLTVHANGNGSGDKNNNHNNNANGRHNRKYGAATAPITSNGSVKHCNSASSQYRSISSGPAGTVQLTPLWEHILRNRTLPDTICPAKMFTEFLERLRDPEWQVRQHALRVLVDVLVVMREKADSYMDPLIPQLVENLGHQAPTVRKGALDCLRVYLAETAMPETILLQILDIGLNQKITNEPFGGRLTCGVMLSLPALVQSTLNTSKRHFILRTTIDMLTQKMGQVTHQEITLKVLSKIRELVGESEFVEFMTPATYKEFDLLCNVYGVKTKAQRKIHGPSLDCLPGGSWRLLSQNSLPSCWRSSEEEEERLLEKATQAKVIMETDIKINDETLIMRLVEAKDDDSCLDTEAEEVSLRRSKEGSYTNSLDDDVICGRLMSAKSSTDSAGVVQLLSDSEIEEISRRENSGQRDRREQPSTPFHSVVTPSTPSRTPKRVTFGGEVVKMRTPDSDAASSSNNNISRNSNGESEVDAGGGGGADIENSVTQSSTSSSSTTGSSSSPPPHPSLSQDFPNGQNALHALSLDIPNDNTKPLQPRPKTSQSPKRERSLSVSDPPETSAAHSVSPLVSNSPRSPGIKRRDSAGMLSPRSPFRRLSVSPVDNIVSPKAPHKEIEVLHNLQRDPSPAGVKSAARRASLLAVETADDNEQTTAAARDTQSGNQSVAEGRAMSRDTPPPPRSWEELEIVDDETLLDLRSGDWRHRLRGIIQLEESLRSSENLAKIQPCLDSLLRTLLSSERNAEVAEEKRRLLMNLISRLPLDNLEDRTVQIMTGLCRQGGPGANRVCKALMQRLPPAAIVLKLISDEFLHAKSSRFREHALQMVMFALMTFPSTCFDAITCVTNATYAALNRKRRVRQAALDVLAVLGQISSPHTVMDVVQNVAIRRDDGEALLAAVKARLARKQLPMVSADGMVQYTLRVPSPMHGPLDDYVDADGDLPPDVAWITRGVGSVSPTSLKRRAMKNRTSSQQSFCCLPTQEASGPHNSSGGSNHSDDAFIRKHSYYSPLGVDGAFVRKGSANYPKTPFHDDNYQYKVHPMLGHSGPLHFGFTSKRYQNGDYSNYLHNRRTFVDKSCSDSSMDGRSSDSTYTSSNGSGGVASNGAAVAVAAVTAVADGTDGISGRFTRQPGNSRFPAMDAAYIRVHKPPTYHPGMGAYAHLQQQQYQMSSTYPKINYNIPSQVRRRSQPQQQSQPYPSQQQQHQQQLQSIQHNPPYFVYKFPETRRQEKAGNATTQEHSKAIENGRKSQAMDSTTGDDYFEASDMANESSQQKLTNNNNNNGRRFVNVDKFITQSTKSAHTNDLSGMESSNINNNLPPAATTDPEASRAASTTTDVAAETSKQSVTPVSIKSSSYSQKSTASAQSDQQSGESHQDMERPGTSIIEIDDASKTMDTNKWTTGEKVVQMHPEAVEINESNASAILAQDDGNDQKDGENATASQALKRTSSVVSLQSKTESIKTQLEETPATSPSRSQSLKSLVIEEDIEDNESFVVVEEEPENENGNAETPKSRRSNSLSKRSEGPRNDSDVAEDFSGRCSRTSSSNHRTPSSSGRRSPTIAELKSLSRRNSMMKSMELPYEGRPPSKQESLDNTTETSSQSSTQLVIPATAGPSFSEAGVGASVKASPCTPLKQKSKTCHLLNRNKRRVSPVKQAIKMAPVELFPPTMQRFERPREALLKALDQLDSINWEMIIVGLKSLVRLVRHHADYMENQMHMVCIQLTRSVRNLRSQVARAACQASSELFIAIKSKTLEQECDDLVCALLQRSADTNRFLRGDATRALEAMCDNLAAPKIVNILSSKGANHANSVVRTTTAKLLNRLVERLGVDRTFALTRDCRDKIVLTGASLLMEGSLETRSYAKSLFRLLAEHPGYERMLLEVIPERLYRNVEKALRSIR